MKADCPFKLHPLTGTDLSGKETACAFFLPLLLTLVLKTSINNILSHPDSASGMNLKAGTLMTPSKLMEICEVITGEWPEFKSYLNTV